MANHTLADTRTSHWRSRLAILLIVLAAFIGPSTSGGASAAATNVPSSPVDPELLAEEQATIDAARQAYAEAGLEFPHAEIRFHEDPAHCRGHDGYYLLRFDGTATIDVCYPRQDADIRHIPRARILWHELAHAYIEPRTDAAAKTEVLTLLGLTDWDEGTWSDLGKENAAEILVWGIADGRYRPRDVTEFDCATKTAAYELLTGHAGPTC